MSLILNTNIMAYDINRTLNNHYDRMAASTQRLSSGLRISTAADDASGYAIRELMQSEMAMLGQGKRNANDAISLIQTADGALSIIDEKLIRMKELAEQASTGSYDAIQREIINDEYQIMASEITRIANATDFNGLKLLDGSLSGPTSPSSVAPPPGQPIAEGALKVHFGSGNDSAEDYFSIEVGESTSSALGVGSQVGVDPNTYAGDSHTAKMLDEILGTKFDGDKLSQVEVDALSSAWENDKERYIDSSTGKEFPSIEAFMKAPVENGGLGTSLTITQITGNASLSHANLTDIGDQLDKTPTAEKAGSAAVGTEKDPIVNPAVASESYKMFEDMIADAASPFVMTDKQGKELAEAFKNDQSLFLKSDRSEFASFAEFASTSVEAGGLGITMTSDQFAQAAGGTNSDGSPATPGASAVKNVEGPQFTNIQTELAKEQSPFSLDPGNNILTQNNAQAALGALDAAIVAKDVTRAALGAAQNRLESTVSNLTVQIANTQASESGISDIDFSSEMTEFVRNQTLMQSALSILTQANAIPQTIFQMLSK